MSGSIFIRIPGQPLSVLSSDEFCYARDLWTAFPVHDGFVSSEGKIVNTDEELVAGRIYTVIKRLRGGKGGFGSMLRAIGAQIEKTTNREACRDLSGRRMRDVNNEKKMLEYLEKKAEKEREREKKKLEKLERMTQVPKHFFNDPEYENKLHESVENVDKALEKGLVSHSNKRKLQTNGGKQEGPTVKKGLWLGMPDISDSDSDEDEAEDVSMNTAISRSRESSSGSEAGTSSSKGETRMIEDIGQESSKPEDCVIEFVKKETENMDKETKMAEDVEQESSKGDSVIEVGGVETEKKTDRESSPCEDGHLLSVADDKMESSTTESKDEVENIDSCSSEIVEKKSKHEEMDGEVNAQIGSDKDKDAEPPLDITKDATEKENLTKEVIELPEVDLTGLATLEDLQNLGLELLKAALMKRGVKCGGSLRERAQRLLIVKDLASDQIDSNLLAKKSKQRNRSKKT